MNDEAVREMLGRASGQSSNLNSKATYIAEVIKLALALLDARGTLITEREGRRESWERITNLEAEVTTANETVREFLAYAGADTLPEVVDKLTTLGYHLGGAEAQVTARTLANQSLMKHNEKIMANERAALARVATLLEALEEIRRDQGRVCDGFELCSHAGCRSSYTSWVIADKALKGGA